MRSKLPDQSPSIFTTMSKMAHKHQAINLAQGFPDFGPDPGLLELVHKAMTSGHNQYAPLAGVPRLLKAISSKIHQLHGHTYDPQSEITVTNGATQALYNAITAFIHPGDEVILLEPAYDSYEPAIRLSGGKTIRIPMFSDGELNLEGIKEVVSNKSRMLILNSPHNPSGRIVSRSEMLALEEILEANDVLLLSDEVYEHLIFDEAEHESATRFEKLRERALVCASFGKTFHTTGWKLGYCAAPSKLMQEFRKVHEYNVYCVNHPMQLAVAEFLEDPSNYGNLGLEMQAKRDRFRDGLSGSRFKIAPCAGTYFQLLDYSEISDLPDTEFAEHLVKEHGIASIPISVFSDPDNAEHMLRFCFAKGDTTLDDATAILRAI